MSDTDSPNEDVTAWWDTLSTRQFTEERPRPPVRKPKAPPPMEEDSFYRKLRERVILPHQGNMLVGCKPIAGSFDLDPDLCSAMPVLRPSIALHEERETAYVSLDDLFDNPDEMSEED